MNNDLPRLFGDLRVTSNNPQYGGIVQTLTQLSLTETGQHSRLQERRNTRVRLRLRFTPYSRPRPRPYPRQTPPAPQANPVGLESPSAVIWPDPTVTACQALLQGFPEELQRERLLRPTFISLGKTEWE
ncbi:hypothetical protein GGH13_009794, partial [Coemansia sp. S155-1]